MQGSKYRHLTVTITTRKDESPCPLHVGVNLSILSHSSGAEQSRSGKLDEFYSEEYFANLILQRIFLS